MTPYADMPPDERLQAVERLAEFCGRELVSDPLNIRTANDYALAWFKTAEVGEVVVQDKRPETSHIIRPCRTWNPFDNLAALEEVEAAIVEKHGCLTMWRYRKEVKYLAFPIYDREINEIYCTGQTKADAIAQVVHTLMERKE